MPAPKKQIDRRKCDWSMNHDTFNHMTYYAHAWEENQWEGVPIFEKKTNGKKTWAYRTCCICTLFQRSFSRYYVTKRNLHIEHQTHVFFSGNSPVKLTYFHPTVRTRPTPWLACCLSAQRLWEGWVKQNWPCKFIYLLPVVPHKAVAEVSKIGNL